MENKRKLWVTWFIILILSAYIVPYIFMRESGKITGPFLFWIIFSLLAILSIFIITAKWRD